MVQIIIDSADPTAERTLAAYRDERGGVQNVVGQMYQAIVRSEAAYAALETELGVGGQFTSLAEYHTALQAPIAASITTLRTKMTEITTLMRAMESAMPVGMILFPGVPRNGV